MPRIAIITQYFKPEIGAPQNRLYELAAGLKKNGWSVSVITAMPNYPTGKIQKPYRLKFFLKEYIDELEIRRYWIFASNSKKAIPRILNMLSFSISALFSSFFLSRFKADYLLIESPPILLGLTGYILCKLTRTKMIFNVSDIWPLSAKELGAVSEGFLYKRLEWLERFLYRKAFLCTGQSKEITDHISSHGSSRVYLFRNGVNPERFAKISIPGNYNRIKIVYAGLLGIAQGILEICRNVNFSSLGVQFHIYGTGNEKEQIENFLNENPGRGIFYHGTVTSSEIPEVLSSYSATLIPLKKRIYGAVPSKIYESMAAGLPIIFSGDGEGRIIIEKYDLGWTFAPGDYDSLKTIINKLCSDKKALENKSKNCIFAASAYFNRPKQINDFHNYLSSFIK